MDELLGRAWWMLIMRGTVALLFGILALFWPALTLLLLITLFSAYAIAGGIVAIVGGIHYRATHGGWWVPLLLGICSIGAGMIAALVRGITTLVLVAIIGANAIFTGVFDLIAATRLHRRLRNAWMLVLTGVLSVLFGIFVLLAKLESLVIADRRTAPDRLRKFAEVRSSPPRCDAELPKSANKRRPLAGRSQG